MAKLDLASTRGNESARRGLEIALAGGHRILLVHDHPTAKRAAVELIACFAELGPLVAQAASADALPALDAYAMALEVVAPLEVDMAGEPSETVRARLAALPPPNDISETDAPAKRLLDEAEKVIGFSSGERAAVVRVARTIARLDGITAALPRLHIAEALAYLPRFALSTYEPMQPPQRAAPHADLPLFREART